MLVSAVEAFPPHVLPAQLTNASNHMTACDNQDTSHLQVFHPFLMELLHACVPQQLEAKQESNSQSQPSNEFLWGGAVELWSRLLVSSHAPFRDNTHQSGLLSLLERLVQLGREPGTALSLLHSRPIGFSTTSTVTETLTMHTMLQQLVRSYCLLMAVAVDSANSTLKMSPQFLANLGPALMANLVSSTEAEQKALQKVRHVGWRLWYWCDLALFGGGRADCGG